VPSIGRPDETIVAVNVTKASGGSIDKTLSVLEALGEHGRLADIASATGLPKSTVHRILQALVDRGFARSDGSGGYLAGPRILTLAGQVMVRFDPAREAGGALADLRDRTGQTVHFAMLSGDEAVYVAKIEARQPYRMASRIGMSMPLHCTSIGKAILAELTDDEVTALAGRVELARRTPRTITTVPALLRHLELVRRRGFAIDDEENEGNIRCVGAAVFDHTGRVTGGVSVSTLAFELDLAAAEALGPTVLDAARAVSKAIGAPAERTGPDASPAAARSAG
jgi:DNA-binding IclR family transcriptional regulator